MFRRRRTTAPSADDDDSRQQQQRRQEHYQELLLSKLEQYLLQQQQQQQQQQQSLTLPAAAVGWLTQVYCLRQHENTDFSTEDSNRRRMRLIRSLFVRKLTHLRITPDPWPCIVPSNTTTSSSSSRRREGGGDDTAATASENCYGSTTAFSRNLHLAVMEHLHVLWLDRVPLDWVATFPGHLRILRVEHACIYDLSSSPLLPTSLTHVKLENCCLGERSGLRPKRIVQTITQQDKSPAFPVDDNGCDALKTPAKFMTISSTPPFALLPNLRTLNLSHNEIHTEATALAGIDQRRYQHPYLTKVDISYNFLTALPRAHERFSETLQTLILSHNHFQSVTGIDRAWSLRVLYLDHNRLHDLHSTANALACLPHLQELYLEGNPLQYIETGTPSSLIRIRKQTQPFSKKKNPAYRVDVLNAFRERRLSNITVTQLQSLSMRQVQNLLPKLDGELASYAELKGLQARTFVPIAVAAVEAASRQAGQVVSIQTQRTVPEDVAMENAAHMEVDGSSHVFVPAMIRTQATNRNYRKRQRRKVSMLGKNEETNHFLEEPVSTTTTLYHPPLVSFTLKEIFALSLSSSQVRPDEATDINNVGQNNRSFMTTQSEDETKNLNGKTDPLRSTSNIDYEENIGMKYIIAATDRLNKETLVGKEEYSTRVTPRKSIARDVESDLSDKQSKVESSLDFHDPFDEVTLPITNKSTKEACVSISSSASSSIFHKNTKSEVQPPLFVANCIKKTNSDDLPRHDNVAQHFQDAIPNTKLGNLSLSAITREDDDEEPNYASPLSASTELSATTAETNPQSPSADDHHDYSRKLLNQEPTARATNLMGKTVKQSISPVRSSGGCSSQPSSSNHLSTMSPEESTAPAQLPLRISSFSENHWVEEDGSSDNNSGIGSSPPSSLFGVPPATHRAETPASKKEAFKLAETKSVYHGPGTYRNMLILDNLELYFQLFVFAASTMPEACFTLYGPDNGVDGSYYEPWRDVLLRCPRIQLWQVDIVERDRASNEVTKDETMGVPLLLENNQRESLVCVWNEKVVACGKAALRRLTPNRGARLGFHGELLWSAAESSHMKPEVVIDCRETICCFSNSSFYIIADHDVVSSKFKDRSFPRPIPKAAHFKDAMWPHALACHQFQCLKKIVIGFEFQRLTLHFDDPTSSFPTAIYVLLTCNKLETVKLLKTIQELTSKAKEQELMSPRVEDPIGVVQIENDDAIVLESLTAAVAPERLDVVRHYQILQQQWKHGNRGAVRRVCVMTESKIFLLDEDYLGDGSDSLENNKTPRRFLGNSVHRLVDSADLNQIVEVQAATADPRSITIVIKPSSKLKKTRNWRLLCRDGRGAEKLVEDARKAMVDEHA